MPLIPIPFVVGGLAAYFTYRYVAGRRDPTRIELSDGRRVKLVSSVAILNPPSYRLLTFEYLSGLVSPTPADIRDEAQDFLQTVAVKREYAKCRDATVTVRLLGKDHAAPVPASRILTFQRDAADSPWLPAKPG